MSCHQIGCVAVLHAPALSATIQVSDQCSIEAAILAANTDSKQGNCPAGSGSDTILLPGKTLIPQMPPGKTSLEVVEASGLWARDKTIIDGQGGTFGFIQVGSMSKRGSLNLEGLTIREFQPSRDGGQAPLSVLEAQT